MVPIKTSVEDIQTLLTYLGKQIGWVDQPRIEKALGKIDDRKIGAMVEFGLILRDEGNLRVTERGLLFNANRGSALREVLATVELYRATLEWVHYGRRAQVTAAEIGQYWESSHADSLGDLKGTTLKDGAVTFGRVVEGAELGTFVVGRGGKETRMTFRLAEVDLLVNGAVSTGEAEEDQEEGAQPTPVTEQPPVADRVLPRSAPSPASTVSVSASPNVHVNVEIHIAADATADTVREIFKNMAYYVLGRSVTDDDE